MSFLSTVLQLHGFITVCKYFLQGMALGSHFGNFYYLADVVPVFCSVSDTT